MNFPHLRFTIQACLVSAQNKSILISYKETTPEYTIYDRIYVSCMSATRHASSEPSCLTS